MSRAKQIRYIVIHCSASFGTYESMENYWFRTLGWKTGGYHRFIDVDGRVFKPYTFEKITNGVKGFNEESIHICYQGGVDKLTNKAKDTRTDAQKGGILDCIREAYEWLIANDINTETGIIVLGHRDFSNDTNKNNIIDPWERIKECPSFDAMNEYKWITINNKQNYTLPRNRD